MLKRGMVGGLPPVLGRRFLIRGSLSMEADWKYLLFTLGMGFILIGLGAEETGIHSRGKVSGGDSPDRKGWRMVSAGLSHTCGVRNIGELYCWGDIGAGGFENEFFAKRTTPVPISTELSDWLSVSAGDLYTCALRTTGEIFCWWKRVFHRPPFQTKNTETFQILPTPLEFNDWVTLSSGGAFQICAIRKTGQLYCWKTRHLGKEKEKRIVPEPLNFSDWRSVSSGGAHTCAIRSTGKLYCWGNNSFGQLGDGTRSNFRTTMLPISSNLDDWSVISAGGNHTCAIRSTGKLYCWGNNSNGQLGDGTKTHRSIPTPVSAEIADWIAVSTGGLKTCAIRRTGELYCWGQIFIEKEGAHILTDQTTPAPVPTPFSDWESVSVGSFHTCAIRRSGNLYCWGFNSMGQLGINTTMSPTIPVPVPLQEKELEATEWVNISTGGAHTCAISQTRKISCWGFNLNGQLGNGTKKDSLVPIPLSIESSGWVTITAGGSFTCAIRNTGELSCWGENANGELGDGSKTPRNIPAPVFTPFHDWVTVSAGDLSFTRKEDEHACAIRRSGQLYCWGSNTYGQLGDGTKTDRSYPTPVSTNFTDWVVVSTGGLHTCAIRRTGQLYCWGKNSTGQLGTDTRADELSPAPISTEFSDWTALSAGGRHTCAIRRNGHLYCWGDNSSGQLGDGTKMDRLSPIPVSTEFTDWIQVSAGGAHTCAIRRNGNLYCWGNNDFGQLGDGSTSSRITPTPVSTDVSDWVAVSAGNRHTCALRSNRKLYCWGNNLYGRLGDGTNQDRLAPVPVVPLYREDTTQEGEKIMESERTEPIEDAVPLSSTERGTGGRDRSLGNTSPVFSGITEVRAPSDTEFILFWKPASDDTTPSEEFVYEICQSSTKGECLKNFTPNYIAGTQTYSFLITGLTPGTTYYFVVRARDLAGNRDGNEVEVRRAFLSGVKTLSHTCAVLFDHTVRCWGGGYGIPVSVTGINNAVGISQGGRHTCAVLSDGTVKCWGSNRFGQLGDGTNVDSNLPVSARGIRNAIAVSAGGNHTCALLSDGSVRCWGSNNYGQLGNGTKMDISVPTGVWRIRNAIAVSAGLNHTCVLLSDGTIRCWGENFYGQLGNGTAEDSDLPVSVGEIRNAVIVSSGVHHTCALLHDGTVKCWGAFEGESDFETKIFTTPVSISEFRNAVALSAGDEYTCVVLSDGTVKCWGSNQAYQYGEESKIRNAVSVYVGNSHTCVLLSDTTVQCWGSNGGGQLGIGRVTHPDLPVLVKTIRNAIAISTGSNFSCALLSDGTVKCWGGNIAGELGNGTDEDSPLPVPVVEVSNAISITTGRVHACALLTNRTVQCWGRNWDGQLGNTQNTDFRVPVTVPLIHEAVSVSAGEDHTCTLHLDGTVRCWGKNDQGQLGNGTSRKSLTPLMVSGITGAVAVSAGGNHTCALLSDGTIRCWGKNFYGQLGDGTLEDSRVPVTVAGITNAIAISAGGDHTCALLSDHTVKCWGGNWAGQLGNRTIKDWSAPISPKGITHAVAISAGMSHTCALLSEGSVRCWGENSDGQLGDGTGSFHRSYVPVKVSGLSGAVAVSTGWNHTCALLADGTIRCWGKNKSGQLGGGWFTKDRSDSPVSVINP
jgi:alpha-tubulin suppressor-like RCC1 family protein